MPYSASCSALSRSLELLAGRALGDAARLVVPEGLRGGYYRPSDQGREAEPAEAWRRRGQPADSPTDGVAGPSIG